MKNMGNHYSLKSFNILFRLAFICMYMYGGSSFSGFLFDLIGLVGDVMANEVRYDENVV